ncbi:MAG: SDR family NAD(P)-dependent oxidoreductase [Bacteroidota bacterium]
MKSLHGKTAFITGATGGMGTEIALCLARENVNLVLLGRDSAKLGRLKEAIKGISDAKVDVIRLDLGKNIEKEVHVVMDPERNIDILIFAAGSVSPNEVEEGRGKVFEKQFNVNFFSTVSLIGGLLPRLKQSKGQIVIISSSIIKNAKGNLSAYGASKHALAGFTEALRYAVHPHGIRVMNVVPGRTATGMQEKLAQETDGTFNPDILIQPIDIATTVTQALKLPYTAEITDIFIRPMNK